MKQRPPRAQTTLPGLPQLAWRGVASPPRRAHSESARRRCGRGGRRRRSPAPPDPQWAAGARACVDPGVGSAWRPGRRRTRGRRARPSVIAELLRGGLEGAARGGREGFTPRIQLRGALQRKGRCGAMMPWEGVASRRAARGMRAGRREGAANRVERLGRALPGRCAARIVPGGVRWRDGEAGLLFLPPAQCASQR
jgi:hypothetical protein